MSRTAVFRADATPEIGSGHVMRSLTLAEEWLEHGGRALMCGVVPEGLHRRITDAGVKLITVEGERPLAEDAAATIALAQGSDSEWVVVDGYAFDTGFVSSLRSAGLSVLQFADGVTDLPYAPDVLLDQNLGAEHRHYNLSASGAKALLGIEYASLGRQFRDRISEKRISERASKVLVTFGGSDATNTTEWVLDALAGIEQLESVVVVIGVSNPQADEIEARCEGDSRFTCLTNVNNMAELMTEADMAIAAAGSTSWELAALGVPSILVTTADNQAPIAQTLAERGVAVSVGWTGEIDASSIKQVVESLASDQARRRNMSRAGQTLVDGHGAGRVVDAMLAHSKG